MFLIIQFAYSGDKMHCTSVLVSLLLRFGTLFDYDVLAGNEHLQYTFET